MTTAALLPPKARVEAPLRRRMLSAELLPLPKSCRLRPCAAPRSPAAQNLPPSHFLPPTSSLPLPPAHFIPPTSYRRFRSSSFPLIPRPSYQVKVQRAVHHSLSTGKKFNDQLRSHTEFRNPAIATQLAARFNVVPHDSNLNKSKWNPRALDEEGT